MYFLATLFAIAVIGYAILTISAYVFQPRMVYFPYPYLETTPEQVGLEYEDVNFQASDGVLLHGWYLPAAGAEFTLIFLHGNGGNISHRLESLKIFNHLGLDVLIFDYRGYGRSQGSPTESGTYSDAAGAWEYLTETRGVDPTRIVIFGRSLGAAVATWLALQHGSRGLMIESAFTSIEDMGSHHYPWLPIRWLTRFHYNSLTRMPDIDVPLLVIHSRDDEIVPFKLGQRLFDAATNPKEFLELRGGHNDGFLRSGQSYVRGLRGFLESLDDS